MNRRRQHPAAAAARRARFYRAAWLEEQVNVGDAAERRVSPHSAADGDGASSSRASGLSGRVDGGRFLAVEDAA